MPQTLGVESRPISVQIVSRVAELEGADPADLPPLYDAVDPDALETIFAETASGAVRFGEITFPYAGYEVTVGFDGEPSVTVE